MKNIATYGYGGLGKEIVKLIKDINFVKATYRFHGYYVDFFSNTLSENDKGYLGGISSANSVTCKTNIAIAIGDVNGRKKIRHQLTNKLIEFPNLIHPTVIIDKEMLDNHQGVIINANSFISDNVEIGDFSFINVNSVIGHDVKIGKYVSIMPSVNVSGNVEIGDNVYIGVGATIVNNIKIGKNSFIGAGSVVLHDVPENKFVLGNPARVIKNCDLHY